SVEPEQRACHGLTVSRLDVAGILLPTMFGGRHPSLRHERPQGDEMYRTYGYPVDVEWRGAHFEERRSRSRTRVSVNRPSSHRTTRQVYAAPHKRPIF